MCVCKLTALNKVNGRDICTPITLALKNSLITHYPRVSYKITKIQDNRTAKKHCSSMWGQAGKPNVTAVHDFSVFCFQGCQMV